jgi:hypothetical protein
MNGKTRMSEAERTNLIHRMAQVECRMQAVERGQTTAASLKSEIALLADAIFWILSDIGAKA